MFSQRLSPGTFAAAAFCLLALAYGPYAEARLTAHLDQSFFFDWTPPGLPYPIPVTQQCETIHIKWGRGAAQGPNPVPPYYLQVYSSRHTVPIIIEVGDVLEYDWAVPFAPGTIYQICMFDKNGNTGGCQGAYTVVPSATSTEPQACQNVTFPSPLEVEGIVNNGPISMYGWIEQCTDIEVRPKGGTPPYTFTIAPSLHPPYNITGEGAMNWTVSLSWSTGFFISVTDSTGASWSNGLLHSGGPGTTSCLAGDAVEPEGLPPSAAIGAGIGGIAVGLLAGIITMFFVMRMKIKKLKREGSVDLSGEEVTPLNPTSRLSHSQYRPVPVSSVPAPYVDNSTRRTGINSYPSTGMQYHVEPLTMPSEDGRRRPFVANPSSRPPSSVVVTHSQPESFTSPAPHTAQHNDVGRPQSQRAVYVLHHDSQGPPVTIFHEQGQQIVELPPRYPDGGQISPHAPPSSAMSTSNMSLQTDSTPSDAPAFLQQPRRPNDIRKGKQKASNLSLQGGTTSQSAQLT